MGRIVNDLMCINGIIFVPADKPLQECDLARGIIPFMGQPIGDTLMRLRTDARMTTEELADEAAVGRSTVYRIENGTTPSPDVDTLRKLTDALDMTLTDFFALVERGESAGLPIVEVGDTTPASLLTGRGDEGSTIPATFFRALANACIQAAGFAGREYTAAMLEELAIAFECTAEKPGNQPERDAARAAAAKRVRTGRLRRHRQTG